VCVVACDLQGGGFSPKRLRAMLLGVDKRRKGHDAEEEEDAGAGDDDVPRASVRSDADARGGHSAPSSFPPSLARLGWAFCPIEPCIAWFRTFDLVVNAWSKFGHPALQHTYFFLKRWI